MKFDFGVRKVRRGDAGLELAALVSRRWCPPAAWAAGWGLPGVALLARGLSLAGALLLGVGCSGAPWQADWEAQAGMRGPLLHPKTPARMCVVKVCRTLGLGRSLWAGSGSDSGRGV